jgi:hypothetical protein
VPPYAVADLYDYHAWLGELLEHCGGSLNDGSEVLAVQLLGDPPRLLLIEEQRLIFYNGVYLALRMSVDDTLTARNYGYHFARPDNSLIWRIDKHPLTGGGTAVCHIHEFDGDAAHTPYAEVDLEDVLQRIYESGELESLPA